MSEYVAYRPVRGVFHLKNSDHLSVVKVGSFQVVHAREEAEKLRLGQTVCHFPTDICIDPEKAVELGVDKYLRKVRYKNEGEKVACKVVAARLRGAASYGFIAPQVTIDEDQLDEHFGIWKYEPPPYTLSENGVVEREDHPQFPKYTKIKRVQFHPDAWTEGLPVRVTEKLHGMNCRLGVVQVEGEWRYMVGSHNVILREYANMTEDGQVKMGAELKRNAFWELLDENVMNLLNHLCEGDKPVVVFGERVGAGVQDLDYGFAEPTLRVFDIMVDGEYLAWDLVKNYCEMHKVQTVPVLYEGSFTWCLVDNMTDGGSTVANPSTYNSAFKGREGVVITPLTETFSDVLGDRLIGKSISCDYEARNGGTEYH